MLVMTKLGSMSDAVGWEAWVLTRGFTDWKKRAPFAVMTRHCSSSNKAVFGETHKCDLASVAEIRT